MEYARSTHETKAVPIVDCRALILEAERELGTFLSAVESMFGFQEIKRAAEYCPRCLRAQPLSHQSRRQPSYVWISVARYSLGHPVHVQRFAVRLEPECSSVDELLTADARTLGSGQFQISAEMVSDLGAAQVEEKTRASRSATGYRLAPGGESRDGFEVGAAGVFRLLLFKLCGALLLIVWRPVTPTGTRSSM
jgi:hypothetical protein